MMLLASHNSATGEPGGNFLSRLFSPFARCQSLSIARQFLTGCRLFDLRVRQTRNGFVFAHGLWVSSSPIRDVLAELDSLAEVYDIGVPTFAMLTYEGKAKEGTEVLDCFRELCVSLKTEFPHINFFQFNVKKPTWRALYIADEAPAYVEEYEKLIWPNPKILVPIPWLWAKLRTPSFTSGTFSMVDFL